MAHDLSPPESSQAPLYDGFYYLPVDFVWQLFVRLDFKITAFDGDGSFWRKGIIYQKTSGYKRGFIDQMVDD